MRPNNHFGDATIFCIRNRTHKSMFAGSATQNDILPIVRLSERNLLDQSPPPPLKVLRVGCSSSQYGSAL